MQYAARNEKTREPYMTYGERVFRERNKVMRSKYGFTKQSGQKLC